MNSLHIDLALCPFVLIMKMNSYTTNNASALNSVKNALSDIVCKKGVLQTKTFAK